MTSEHKEKKGSLRTATEEAWGGKIWGGEACLNSLHLLFDPLQNHSYLPEFPEHASIGCLPGR